MSDNFENQDEQPEETAGESFAELFESYQAGMSDDLKVGDKINGKIIAVDANSVFVDTGTKVDGAVEKDELKDENGEFQYAVGDKVELYVVAVDENGIRLSRAVSGIGGLNTLRDAFKGGVPVEGKVKSTVKGGFQVEVLQRRAFCPISQMDVKYIENPEEYVGSTYRFLIKRFEENGRNIVLSRREILENERRAAQEALLKDLNVDAVVEGTITRLQPYGAFVDLGAGVEGMVHISELSWSRLQKPDEAVKVGDTVRVKVLSIKTGKKDAELKIALSVKQTETDPWEAVVDTIQIGARLKGKVIRCTNFGAFVEISPGIEGLVHISEMSYVKRIGHPEEVVSAGDRVWVLVKDMNIANRRISLSIRDAEGDPWADINEKYTVGQIYEGVFEKKADFGYFVSLEPGVTGLVPKSKAGRSSAAGAVDKLNPGDPIAVVIEEIQPTTRRISLGLSDIKGEVEWQSFADGSDTSLSSLGEELRKALKNKDNA